MSSAPTAANGNDRIALFDGKPREADALPPEELILLAAPLVDLARAAREDQDRLPVAHQGADVVSRAADHPARRQEIAPHGYRVMRVLPEPADGSRRRFQTSAIMNGRSKKP